MLTHSRRADSASWLADFASAVSLRTSRPDRLQPLERVVWRGYHELSVSISILPGREGRWPSERLRQG